MITLSARVRTALSRAGRPWVPTVVLILLLLLLLSALSEFLILRYTSSRWPELARSRAQETLEAAVGDFAAVQNSILRSAEDAASDEEVIRYLSGKDQDRVMLFQRLGRAIEDQGSGVEIYDRTGSLIAWSGRSGPLQGREVRIALDGRPTSYAMQNPVSSQLFVTTPVRLNGDIIGAVLFRKTLEVSFPFTNRYLDREGLTERLTRQLGVEVRFDFSEGAEPSRDGRFASTALKGIGDRTVGVVSVMHPTPSLAAESISARFHSLNAFLVIALIFILLTAAWNSTRGVGPLKRAFTLTVLLWTFRYLLLWLDIPSGFAINGIFDPALFASPFGRGIAKSVGELTITIVVLAASTGLLFNGLVRKREPGPEGKGRPGRFLLLIALAALLAAGLVWSLRGYVAVVRSAVFDSSLEYLDPRVLFPPVDASIMLLNLIVLALCIVLLGTALTRTLLDRFQRVGGPNGTRLGWIIIGGAFGLAAILFGLSQAPLVPLLFRLTFGAGILGLTLLLRRLQEAGHPAVRRTTLIVSLLFAAGMLPSPLGEFVGEHDRRRIEVYAQDSVRPADTWFSLVVLDALRDFTTPRVVRILEEKSKAGLARLAFAEWAQSPACREGYTSIFTVFDEQGNRVSRFSIGGQVGQASTVDTSIIFDNIMEVSVRDIGSGGQPVKVYTGLTSIQSDDGTLIGFAQVTIAAGQQTPFRGETPIFLRGTSEGSLQTFYRSVSVSEFSGGRLRPGETEVFPIGYELPGDIRQRLSRSDAGWLWRVHAFAGQEYETLFISRKQTGEDLLAFSLPLPGLGGELVTLVKLGLHGVCLILLAIAFVGAKSMLRGGIAPKTFRARLLVALVVTALVPLGILSVYGQYMTRQRLLDESARVVDETTRKVEAYFTTSPAGITDPVMISAVEGKVEQIAAETNADFNLYVGRNLFVTSRPELVELGMLDTRISGGAYAALAVTGERFFLETASVGKYRYTVGYRPLLDRTGSYSAAVSVPTLFREDRLEEENTRRNAFLFAIYAAILVALLVIAALLANRIARPILLLTEATRKVAGGDLEVQVEVPRADGEVRDLIDSFDAMTRDLKKNRDELIRYERELAWKEMARQVAHEIKNPLTPMRLSVQHLRQAYRDRVQDFDQLMSTISTTIIDQIDTLSRIASEFSAFARMPRPKLESCDVNAIVTESIGLFSQDAALRFEINLITSLPSVLADREELRRAFINIIRNGIQAMDGKGTITVMSRVVEEGMEVVIRDRGKGIPEEMMEKLFQPNFSTKSDGMGLGLAITKKTIEAVGGTISIASTVGEGTTVTVFLPAE